MSWYNGEIEAAPRDSISACAPNTSTCAANPVHQSPLTYELLVDCCKELKDIRESEIDDLNNIVKLFEDKNALLTECLYFLSAFVEDDFCHSLKERIEKNLGIRFKRKDKEKTNEPWVDAYVDEDRTISKRMTLDEFIKTERKETDK